MMIANYTDVEAKKLMLSIMQHITNQITANVLKNLNNMKKLLVIAAMFVGVTTSAQDVYIPNAFTPNGDMRNDYWKPVFDDTLTVSDYLLEVYTRSGELVFETRDSNQYWDGTLWGSNVSESTFVYRLVMRVESNDINKVGFVEVLR
jgi:gliding motility-associated-like protein